MEKRIHVAYGFHVNCYHSYRGDTNDALGFGSDIRIIRKIIASLDALNERGVPVKGTWDCENFFSLETILPRYAPDIIEGMRRRVRGHGDEQIIMGYSNGALGAMQPEKLAASVNLAVSNPQGSGLADLFGECEKIVRPQEVMFTPSQVHTYNALGVKALCLYYSCVPFDAFRTFLPPLDDEKAFNPLTFRYRGEGLTVIPTYSNADVCDAGCLRAWVKELRAKQLSGEIGRDLFLFINMDADAIFWESLNLPVIGSRLANTNGITGLVEEVADLDYVVFDTPGGYLRTHGPAGEIGFTKDTADGNFTGYASWAEKPYNRKIFTAVERSRAAAKAKWDEADFLNRVKLLSTTHFGLATPVLNIARENAANALAQRLTEHAVNAAGELTFYNTSGSALQCAQLSCAPGQAFALQAEGLKAYTVLPMGENSVFLMLRFSENKNAYAVKAVPLPPQPKKERPLRVLESGGARLTFSNDNAIASLTFNGAAVGVADFLSSYLTYGGKRYGFSFEQLDHPYIQGGKAVRLSGKITLPGALSQGEFSYTFFVSDAAGGIFLLADVRYPYTAERDAISTENSTLGRFTDMRWQEAVPLGLRFFGAGDTRVIKRNFEGDISSFRVASFGEADAKNKTLDSFNNQLTAGLVGLTNGAAGLLLGSARSVLSSMAFCPMRLCAGGSVLMNPFGTFTGRQRHHPNRSGDKIPLTYTLIAPQGKSLAPSYNGSRERMLLCLLPFTGETPDSRRLNTLLAFADGAHVEGTSGPLSPFSGENVCLRPASAQAGQKIRSPLLTGVKGNLGKYALRGARAVLYIARRQHAAEKGGKT